MVDKMSETTNETTPPQLPAWAIAAGWTEQDVADGWYVDEDGDMAYANAPTTPLDPRIVTDDTSLLYSMDSSGDIVEITEATTPAAARTCALEIVAAIKRARGEG